MLLSNERQCKLVLGGRKVSIWLLKSLRVPTLLTVLALVIIYTFVEDIKPSKAIDFRFALAFGILFFESFLFFFGLLVYFTAKRYYRVFACQKYNDGKFWEQL